MSLRRAIKAQGLGNFLKLGLAIATSAKVTPAPVPQNEGLRAARVNETGLIGRDVSAQFEIFTETAKLITGSEKAMLNLLDGVCQYTISSVGENFDPLSAGAVVAGNAWRALHRIADLRLMTFCQYQSRDHAGVIIRNGSSLLTTGRFRNRISSDSTAKGIFCGHIPPPALAVSRSDISGGVERGSDHPCGC